MQRDSGTAGIGTLASLFEVLLEHLGRELFGIFDHINLTLRGEKGTRTTGYESSGFRWELLSFMMDSAFQVAYIERCNHAGQ